MKRTTLIISVLLVLTGILVWSTGCKKDDNGPSEFQVLLDSILYQDTIQKTDTLNVKFYGYLGASSCYEFSRIERVSLSANDPPSAIKFKVWGKFEDTGNCADVESYLNGAAVAVTGFIPGNFNILVMQPDGTIMTGLVYVKE